MELRHLFDRWRSHGPDLPAITDYDGRVWSRDEIHDRLNRVASVLVGLGLETGDRVAVLDGWTRQHLEAEYGAIYGGFVRVPLDPAMGAAEQAALITDSGARVLIFSAAHHERAEELSREVSQLVLLGDRGPADLNRLITQTAPGALPPLGPDSLASLSYSGGTTGMPKAIMQTHRNLASVVQNVLHSNPVMPGEIFLNVRTLWPMGASIVLVRLLGGAHLVMGRFSPEGFGDLVAQHRAETTSLVPTQLIRLFDAEPDLDQLATLRIIDIGSSAVPPDELLAIVGTFGPRIAVLYGMTEAPWACYLPASDLADPTRRERLVHSAGREVFGVHLQVVDEDGVPLPPGEVGEITVAGANVMKGYWLRPDLTDQALLDDGHGHRYRSGDLGRIDEEGYLYIVGRMGEQIRTGGKTVSPQEVEHVLLSHPDVADAAVAGVPDREWGEIVQAFVILRAEVTPEELIEHCRERLSGYKTPKKIAVLDELPKSHYGKVLRKRLVAAALDQAGS